MKSTAIAIGICLSSSLTCAYAQTTPERFPVQVAQTQIDDGSIRTVLLLKDSGSFLNYCPKGKVGFIQYAGQMTNPSGCWMNPGPDGHPTRVLFRYMDIKVGQLREFLIDPAAISTRIYEWRTERILP